MVGCGDSSNEMNFKELIFLVKQIVLHLLYCQKNDQLCALLSSYDREDIIYNADETGLFFWMEPNQTLSTKAVTGRKKVKLVYNNDF